MTSVSRWRRYDQSENPEQLDSLFANNRLKKRPTGWRLRKNGRTITLTIQVLAQIGASLRLTRGSSGDSPCSHAFGAEVNFTLYVTIQETARVTKPINVQGAIMYRITSVGEGVRLVEVAAFELPREGSLEHRHSRYSLMRL
jgi:hypothetical protein